MKKIVIAGGGVLGSQIAFQSAYCDFDVTIWLRNESDRQATETKLASVYESYVKAIELMASDTTKSLQNWSLGIADFDNFNQNQCLEKIKTVKDSIKIEFDLAKAVADADLVIEAIVEDLAAKNSFFETLSPLLPEKTIVVTNSSTLLPSKMAKASGRPDKFLSLHFANTIWKNNTAEVMVQKDTSNEAFEAVMQFATDIRMVALPVKKEKSGYLLNSMLIPLLFSGMDLYVKGISDPVSIDTAWTRGTGAPKGPFQILDIIGLNTAHNVVKMYVKVPKFLAPYDFKGMEKLLAQMIAENKLGKETGEGFYKY